MSSWDLILELKQETNKLEKIIFRFYFRVIIRPNDLQKLSTLYIYNYKDDVIGY